MSKGVLKSGVQVTPQTQKIDLRDVGVFDRSLLDNLQMSVSAYTKEKLVVNGRLARGRQGSRSSLSCGTAMECEASRAFSKYI